MVNPLNFPYNPENINHRTEFDNGTAIGMPPINFSTRKNSPITNVNNTYEYNPSHNSSRRYSKNLAPSGILTEAFFKSRVLLGPVFFQNEAAVKYENISRIFSTSNDIKINMLRVA
tara:strand:+ start:215 stop:562 length:348 start_codon:yes stop_codon:yes gene_type:complete